MSFLKSLFGFGGGGTGEKGAASIAKETEHAGFHIAAMPYREQGQFQVAGVISKVVDGEKKEHRFVRADRFASLEEAADFALLKGRQIIDQQGARIFDGSCRLGKSGFQRASPLVGS